MEQYLWVLKSTERDLIRVAAMLFEKHLRETNAE